MKEKERDIDVSFLSVVNANIRHSRVLSSYAKLVCVELIALEDRRVIRETDDDISYLTGLPLNIVSEAIDMLLATGFITAIYLEEGREITLSRSAL